MRLLSFALAALVGAPTWAQDVKAIVDMHVLPGYRALAAEAAELSEAARADCTATNQELLSAYHDAFDAWVRVSHLRFGPSEQDDRAFALAFWPDPRGKTPKALATLIRDVDPVVSTADAFSTVSVAARGFYAMEYLLFDAQFTAHENSDYVCTLVEAVAQDIDANASAILGDWESGYADLLGNPGNDTYRTEAEAAQQLFTSLSIGLEFTWGTRLARPMGTFDRPRPNRAEARRSGRSLRNVTLAIEATYELAELLSGGDEGLSSAFDRALERANTLDDPVFAGVAEPGGRLRVEILQTAVYDIRKIVGEELGPSLGITAGFNSLDGD